METTLSLQQPFNTLPALAAGRPACMLITGASSGIGRATAVAAAASGWKVMACGVEPDVAILNAGHYEYVDVEHFDPALFHFAKCLETDLHARDICVQTVSPGFVRTPLTDRNDFRMPMCIEPEAAAIAILALVKTRTRTGFFPRRFAGLIRLMATFPYAWQAAICRALASRQGPKQ